MFLGSGIKLIRKNKGSKLLGKLKNPVHVSGRDFYLLPLHSSLFTKKFERDFWKVRGNSE